MEAKPLDIEPKRKRRWFQFSLRTLMIVVTLLAVACAYLAEEAEAVRARRARLAQIHVPILVDTWAVKKILIRGDESKSPSLLRRWLGDSGIHEIDVSAWQSQENLAETTSIFPESDLYCWECLAP